MASKYWIKLYHEILDDPKMGKMSDRLWRRTIEMFLLAGDYDKDGELPPLEDLAWRLRSDNETLQQDVEELKRIGILSANGSIHLVTNFSERQSAMSGAERISRFRDSRRKEEYYGNKDETEDVTSRYTDIDTDIESDTDKKIQDKEQLNTFFNELKAEWLRLFKDKPQPRTLGGKNASHLRQRMADKFFMENWKATLIKASKSKWLNDNSFFTLWWFILNDDNWQKCYDGNYDDKGAIRTTINSDGKSVVKLGR